MFEISLESIQRLSPRSVNVQHDNCESYCWKLKANQSRDKEL